MMVIWGMMKMTMAMTMITMIVMSVTMTAMKSYTALFKRRNS